MFGEMKSLAMSFFKMAHNGKINAETELRKAEEMKVDKKRLKFRETGILDIYLK